MIKGRSVCVCVCTKSVCLVCCSCTPLVCCQSHRADRLKSGRCSRISFTFKRQVNLHRPAEHCFTWNKLKQFEWFWLAALATCTSNAHCCLCVLCCCHTFFFFFFVLLLSIVLDVFSFLVQVRTRCKSRSGLFHFYKSL